MANLLVSASSYVSDVSEHRFVKDRNGHRFENWTPILQFEKEHIFENWTQMSVT
jgi:hypothetical protein